MKFLQLEILRDEDDEIMLVHGNPLDYEDSTKVFITADMVDLVCMELQKLKKEILASKEAHNG